MTKIAVISDIHANPYSLQAAFEGIDAQNVDITIFLGDTLTYGVSVKDTIELLVSYAASRKVIFIKGNHDQIYFDAQAGREFQYKPFPTFILDSVHHTKAQLGKLGIELESIFPWVESYSIDELFFAHANPHSYGDWSYINHSDEVLSAANKLVSDGFSIGFFGHTHRSVLASVNRGYEVDFNDDQKVTLDRSQIRSCPYIVNPGSIGQPRGSAPSWILIEIAAKSVRLEKNYVKYNSSVQVASIKAANFSRETEAKLISFFDRC
ncbi:metallophosphoesterase family protein [Photobacterium sanguinicancri]|uniref:metallophosphoesterase family protein n=1 Tax=Photobacterium sanguinicancri TaxID=875932 RepID=UPI0021C2D7E7|nr:metallophosphoesterase [Photobacterium sanguinicancri]